ncbi:MAG: N-acetyl sugar amidotransferase [Proteobacteria bacterium]|nr:N-acetyl sugar amidotransferase [Pseudomonadota bacterium]
MRLEEVDIDGRHCVNDPEEGPLEVRYGLPGNVEFCRSCVVSNQRVSPSVVTADTREGRKSTIPFKDGVCEACRVVAKKDTIDWAGRERMLKDLLDRHRSRDGRYDCLIPGSGGKDSVYQSHVLKTKYGMNPLTVTWAPHLYTDVGWRNFTRWSHAGGFDNYLFTPDGQVHRKLTELAYRNLLHPFQPFIYGQRHFPMRMARMLGIRLIFYGEHHAEYGVAAGEDESSLFLPKYFAGDPDGDLVIGGVPVAELARHGITRAKLEPYLPLRENEIRAAGIEVHFLGYFLKWVPQEMYYYAVEATGFEPNTERTEGTHSRYSSIDDKMDGFHYWCAFIKFGIGRCTHEASQEIRHKLLTREEGVALVRRFDGEFPRKHFKEVLEYMGNMSEEEFFAIADGFRSPHLWKLTGNGWVLRHQVA